MLLLHQDIQVATIHLLHPQWPYPSPTLKLKIAQKPHIIWSLGPKTLKYDSFESVAHTWTLLALGSPGPPAAFPCLNKTCETAPPGVRLVPMPPGRSTESFTISVTIAITF